MGVLSNIQVMMIAIVQLICYPSCEKKGNQEILKACHLFSCCLYGRGRRYETFLFPAPFFVHGMC